ncbi:MAG: type II toxin-antitoxin system VapC family toxin [Myxococcales bacterium]|nr:MAG: type II toxin-antitoxin system VapC family toxin [Myxococcales bacterium]
MKPRIYIDTSVFGVSITTLNDPKSRFMREYARRFFSLRSGYEGFISEVVLQEVGMAPAAVKEALKPLISGFPLLPLTPVALDVARMYRTRFVMPTGNESDSVHVAIAVVHRMDSIVTWNLKHMANPAKQETLRLINSSLSLPSPVICSPLEWVSSLDVEEEP